MRAAENARAWYPFEVLGRYGAPVASRSHAEVTAGWMDLVADRNFTAFYS